ncbi:hypothetical protein EDB83DRAFT_2452370 [Lactarius deliciosus]|nr:hypothetical protein EDB83DRAFT_2452370 [Lactarius deliciosus]
MRCHVIVVWPSIDPGAVATYYSCSITSDYLDVPPLPSLIWVSTRPLTESHSLLLASASPCASRPRLSSESDPGAVVEGEGGAKVALHKGRDDSLTPFGDSCRILQAESPTMRIKRDDGAGLHGEWGVTRGGPPPPSVELVRAEGERGRDAQLPRFGKDVTRRSHKTSLRV